jgi:hypothetical protein
MKWQNLPLLPTNTTHPAASPRAAFLLRSRLTDLFPDAVSNTLDISIERSMKMADAARLPTCTRKVCGLNLGYDIVAWRLKAGLTESRLRPVLSNDTQMQRKNS